MLLSLVYPTTVDQSTLERRIKRIRFHMARSLTRLPEFSSRKKVEQNEGKFLRRLHTEYKTAQELLISTYLEIEEDIAHANDQNEVQKKRFWLRVLEPCRHADARRSSSS